MAVLLPSLPTSAHFLKFFFFSPLSSLSLFPHLSFLNGKTNLLGHQIRHFRSELLRNKVKMGTRKKKETYNVLVEILNTCSDILSLLGSYEQVNGFQIRTGSQELLDQHFAQEARAARHKHATIPVEFCYVGHIHLAVRSHKIGHQ